MQGTRIRLIIVGIEGEINLGFIARLAANFRVDEFYLVSPRALPSSPEARRFAANGVYMLDRAIIVNELDEALKGVGLSACTSAKIGQKGDVVRHAVSAREFAEQIAPRYSSIGLVFGRESVGLTREELARCDLLVHIPANPDYPVLNLSHAVGIILYELWQSLNKPQLYEKAPEKQLRYIYEKLEPVIDILVDKERVSQVKAALKHLLWKSGITPGEASLLYYLAKRLRRAIEECEKQWTMSK